MNQMKPKYDETIMIFQISEPTKHKDHDRFITAKTIIVK